MEIAEIWQNWLKKRNTDYDFPPPFTNKLLGAENNNDNSRHIVVHREWLNAEDEGASFQLFGMVNFNCIDLVTQMNKWYASHDESETLMYKIKHGSSSSKHPSAPDDFFMTALNPIYSHFLCLEGGTRGVPFQVRGRDFLISGFLEFWKYGRSAG